MNYYTRILVDAANSNAISYETWLAVSAAYAAAYGHTSLVYNHQDYAINSGIVFT